MNGRTRFIKTILPVKPERVQKWTNKLVMQVEERATGLDDPNAFDRLAGRDVVRLFPG